MKESSSRLSAEAWARFNAEMADALAIAKHVGRNYRVRSDGVIVSRDTQRGDVGSEEDAAP